MRLKVLDQIQVTAVQTDVLRPGDEIDVGADLGRELLRRNPRNFEQIGAAKGAPAPKNKAKPAAPANKATSPRSKAKSAS